MRNKIKIILLCFFLSLIIPINIYGEDDVKTVRVGWFESDLFQEGMGDDEEKSGYSYNYLRKISNYTSWKYEYIYGDWSSLYEMLCNGEIDVMAGMSYTKEREEYMFFPSEAMETDKYYLYKKVSNTSIVSSDLSSFDGKKLGLLKNNRISDFALEWIEEKGANLETIYFDSFESLHEAFENDEIDLEPRTLDGASDLGNIISVVSLGGESSYLAVSKQRPDLLEELNEAISTMNSVEPYVLQELQYNTYGTVYMSRTLSDNENNWLNNHPIIKVGYSDNYLPYCATDTNGDVTGVLKDVINGIFNSLEVEKIPEMEYVAYDTYDDVIKAIKNEEVDIGFPVSSNSWHLEKEEISASSNVISDRGVLFYKDKYLKDDVKKIAAKVNNVFQDEYSSSTYPDAKIIYYETIDECLDAVLNKEVDGTIMDSLRVQYVINRSKYDDLKYIQLSEATGKCFGIKQGNVALLMLINRGLKVLGSSYAYDRSFQYVDSLYHYGFVEFIKSHVIEVVVVVCLIFIIIVTLFVLYLKKQRREIKIKEELMFKAEEANKAKSTFLFNMSHDIRTPMNAILGFNELMKNNINDKEKLEDYLEKTRFSGEYLLGLINNVLEVARIDSGRESLNEEFADLKDESYYIVFENTVNQRKLDFKRIVDINHRYVYADSQKIREILLNLISNAIKYTPDGGEISLILKEKPCLKEGYATYVLDVSDTGVGMSEEFQKHVFDTFTREHNTTESKVAGTGLGMAIVKRLVELMSGTITVNSKLNEGTTFTVKMDLRIVDNPESYLKKNEDISLNENERLDGVSILLAEDNDLNAEIALTLLESLGAKVIVAKDGVECLDILGKYAEEYFDLILMDIQMPNLNGYDAAKKIRLLNDKRANIPIIAMTANAFDEDKKNAFDSGMNDHIAKPLDVAVLVKTIIKYINKDSN